MNKNIELIFAFSLLHTKIIKVLERRLSLHGLTFSEFLVMHQLAQTSTKTMRRIDLAESVSMSASGVTRLLNPMEKLKIVEKEVSPRDARVSFVKLSDAGLELFNDAMQTVTEAADDLLQPLQGESIEMLLDVFKKIK